MRTRIALGVSLALGLSGCCSTAPPKLVDEPPAVEPTAAPAVSTPTPTSTSIPVAPKIGTGPANFKCQLPAPKLSDDACETDADCDVSAPCHAPSCVAKAKANPPKPSTICTRNMVCDSVDANRCGCYQGRCGLIPPAPSGK